MKKQKDRPPLVAVPARHGFRSIRYLTPIQALSMGGPPLLLKLKARGFVR